MTPVQICFSILQCCKPVFALSLETGLKPVLFILQQQQNHLSNSSSDFTDEVPNEFAVGSFIALAGAWLGLEGVNSGLVAFV